MASHVAFDVAIHALKAPQAASARPSPSADRGTPSQFDSMIDDSLPPAEPRARASDEASARPDRNETKPADRPDRADDASKPDDRSPAANAAPDAPAKDDAAQAKDSKDGEAAKKDAKSSGDADKAAADAIKTTTGDATAADSAKTADAAAIAAAIPGQTPAAVAVAVTVAAASTDVTQKPGADGAIDAAGSQKGQAGLLAALQAQAGGKIDGTIDGKAGDKADLKAGDKAAEKAALKGGAKADSTDNNGKAEAAKPAPSADLATAVKPPGAGETDKDPAADTQSKTTTEAHRGATPDVQTKAAPNDKAAAPKVAADIAQPTMPPAPTQQAQASAAIAAPAAAAPVAPKEVAVPLNGVGIEIASRALSGKNQFDIRLDPPDLGRIHVRLDVDHKGNVITHMVADRTDTLDMLRRDSAGLERALQDAGLKTSDNGMQFSLRDQSANQQQDGGRGENTAHLVMEDDQLAARDLVPRDYGRSGTRAGGLDIRV